MQVSVPADKLPNIGVHKTQILHAIKRLHEISVIKMRESGLVNSVYNRGFNFGTEEEVHDTNIQLFKIIRKYVETTVPWSAYAKGGITNGNGTVNPSGIHLPFFFKERSLEYISLPESTGEVKDTAGSIAVSNRLGVPRWINRYIVMLNREIMKAKLPLWVSATCTQYLIDDYEYLVPGSADAKTVLVKVVFHFTWFSWRELPDSSGFEYMVQRRGPYGRGRRLECAASAYMVEAFSLLAKGTQLDSGSPYLFLFYLEPLKRILKTLYKKVDYVPTVYSVTSR